MSKKKNWRQRHGIVAGQGGDQTRKGAPAGSPDARPSLQVVGPGSPGSPAEPVAGVESQVAWLLAKGKVRDAIAVAKELCKKKPGEAAERELATAYCARIDELVRDRAYRDALELARVAAGRHAVGRNLVTSRMLDLELLTGSRNAWVSTAKAALAGDAAAVSRLRRCLDAPAMLTQIDSLPQDFPLCGQARALTAALTAVTSGPVSEDRVLLPEVPRSSPLADWKWLARAIHCFHRREDDFCRRYLAAISPESAPARGAAVLRALLDGQVVSLNGKAGVLAQKLVRAGAGKETTGALARFREALARRSGPHLGKAMEALLRACHKECPELLQPLQREVLIHVASEGAGFYELLRHLARPLETDIDFWIRLAKANERCGLPVVANVCWTAALERLPADPRPGGNLPLRAAIRRHMSTSAVVRAMTQSSPPPDRLSKLVWPQLQGLVWPGRRPLSEAEQNALVVELQDPNIQFERLCRESPHPSHFLHWYSDVRRIFPADWKQRETIANLWSETFPSDHVPCLLLSIEAEQRDAFTTALKHLDRARRLGAPTAQLEIDRRRVTVKKVLRHIKDGNIRSTDVGIAELEELPGVSQGNGPVVLLVLKWLKARRLADEATASEIKPRLDREAGGPMHAAIILESLQSRIRRGLTPPTLLKDAMVKGTPSDAAWNAVEKGIRFASEFGLSFSFPMMWRKLIVGHLSAPGTQVDPDSLLLVGRTALRGSLKDVVLAISHLGLASGRYVAWFLVMRAAGLSPWSLQKRCHTCWRLAVYEARRTADNELLNAIEDVYQGRNFSVPMDLGKSLTWPAIAGSQKELDEVVKRESSIPANGIEAKDFKDGAYAVPLQCDCDTCRSRRAEEAEMATRRGRRRRRDAWMTPDDDEVDLPDDILDLACKPGDLVYLDNPDLEDGLDDEDYDDLDDDDDDDFDDLDDDDDDDFDDDRGARSDVLGRLPQDVLAELAQIVGRFLRPDGTLPAPDELMRLAPGPFRKILEKLEASGITPEDVFGPQARGTRRAGRVIRRRRK